MSGETLKLIRPIPRRPFGPQTPSSPTASRDESAPGTPDINADDLRFLDPRQSAANPDSISRAASLMNLTSSTLVGIYSPSASERYLDERDERDERDELSTPWGTGAWTPVRSQYVDDETYELVRERASLPRRRRRSSSSSSSSSYGYLDGAHESVSPPLPFVPDKTSASSVVLRAALLFVLGVGYGVLVTRLPNKQNLASFGAEDFPEASAKWGYLTLWGGAGMALGSLLPWFDGVWEESFGRHERGPAAAAGAAPAAVTKITAAGGSGKPKAERPSPGMDWVLVMRGIGTFVGIVFAIRRLPWTSTMQVSATLALANPILWYLIDRSKPGFLLSTAVALAGSAALVSFNPDAMPVPAGMGSWLLANSSSSAASPSQPHQQLAGRDTLETAMWTLSVLFCSCVCFGNIGRRLTLNKSAAARGRWGGVR